MVLVLQKCFRLGLGTEQLQIRADVDSVLSGYKRLEKAQWTSGWEMQRGESGGLRKGRQCWCLQCLRLGIWWSFVFEKNLELFEFEEKHPFCMERVLWVKGKDHHRVINSLVRASLTYKKRLKHIPPMRTKSRSLGWVTLWLSQALAGCWSFLCSGVSLTECSGSSPSIFDTWSR